MSGKDDGPGPGSPAERALAYEAPFAWDGYTPEQREAAGILARDYMTFLGEARTERERVEFVERVAQGRGFKRIEIGTGESLQPGEKVYYVNRAKNIALFVIGEAGPSGGLTIVGAHVDFPRVDLKIRPLYEDAKTGLALFKTHYYGGIKKYQYATTPLALTGVVVKRDGEVVRVNIGAAKDDPVFTIPDLLIHLARTVQTDRKAFDAIKGEEMNVLAGATRAGDEKARERFKLAVLQLLNDRYGMVEEDFHSAELALVPAFPPRHVGLDKSMIGAAGQDDGSCSYLAVKALLDVHCTPPRTAGVALFDKEETGSNGATGAQSAWIRQVVADLATRTGGKDAPSALHQVLSRTRAISADVTAAMDPSFGSVHDPHTAAVLGKGVVVEKNTGHSGKSGTSEATAEFMAWVRRVLGDAKLPYQVGTLGAVDAGGGGTIAMFLAQAFNCDVVDAGVPLINMHSPFEISHVADVYSTYLAYKAFLLAP